MKPATAMLLLALQGSGAFLPSRQFPLRKISGWRRFASSSSNLPSLTELSKDPFMSQVSYASELVPLLGTASAVEQKDLADRLSAQLSHSDGIRGFFVTYLTGDGETVADNETVPEILQIAMEKADQEELVSLACMNVVMPTAMVTMHKNADLSAASAKTAERGKRILKSLKCRSSVTKNCEALYAAASATSKEADADPDLIAYWKQFFENYNYGAEQLQYIRRAAAEILDKE